MLNKYDQLGSPQQQQPHSFQTHQPPPPIPPPAQQQQPLQQSRLQNHFTQNPADDDLGTIYYN